MKSETSLTPARELLAPIRAGWNLGNTLDAVKRGAKPGEYVPPREAETAWHNPPVTRTMLRAVCDAGFGAVRLPVTWAQHMDGNGLVDPRWMDRVDEVVRWVLEEGMACFLNVHHDAGAHGWLQATDACHRDFGARFDGLWRQIAARFRDAGDHLVFEAFNEMLDGREHWTETEDAAAYAAHNRWHQRFVDTVRACGGENEHRILSLQTYSAGNSARTLSAFSMPRDPAPGRIILQTHNYDPQGFCWLRAEGRELRDTWGTAEDYREIDTLFSDLAAFSEKHRAPLVIGEFGSEDKQNTPQRQKHAAYFTDKAREAGILCFWWDCGHFSLFDRHEEKLIRPEIAKALV